MLRVIINILIQPFITTVNISVVEVCQILTKKNSRKHWTEIQTITRNLASEENIHTYIQTIVTLETTI